MMRRIAAASPRVKARIAGVFYLLTFLTGIFALVVRSRLGVAAGLVAALWYFSEAIASRSAISFSGRPSCLAFWVR